MPLSKIQILDIELSFADLERKINSRIQSLKRISDGEIADTPLNFKKLIEKIKRIFSGSGESLTINELSLLTHKTYELEDSEVKDFVLKQIEHNWSEKFITGLLYSSLVSYGNNSETIVILNNHKSDLNKEQEIVYNYLLPDGHIELSSKILIDNKDITNVIDYFYFLEPSKINLTYFKYVVRDYFSKFNITSDNFEIVNKLLLMVKDRSNVAKLIIPQIIIRVGSQTKEKSLRNKLLHSAINYIGDLKDDLKWITHETSILYENVKTELFEARKILNRWLVRKVIDIIFTRLPGRSYPERRIFWYKFSDIIGVDENIENTIKVISNVSIPDIERYGIKKQWNSYNDEVAILFRLKNYVIVDFLDGGCAYFYEWEGEGCRIWNKIRFELDDLKRNYIADKVYKTDIESSVYIPNNFRIDHRGEWPLTFDKAISKKILYFDIRRRLIFKNKNGEWLYTT